MNMIPLTGSQIQGALQNPKISFKEDFLKLGNPIKKGLTFVQYAGGYTIVFPYHLNKTKKALRVWTNKIDEAEVRSDTISTYLKNLGSSYFVNFKYFKKALLVDGKLYPIVIMDWVEGIKLKEYINKNIQNRKKLVELADKFAKMVSFLHERNISHGDLQHGNIMVTKNNELILVDYDSMYVPGMENYKDNIKGLPGYQHPTRQNLKKLSSKSDYFSELVIYLSILVYAEEKNLWEKDTEYLLFSQQDIDAPKGASIYRSLNQIENKKIKKLIAHFLNALETKSIENLSPLEDLLVDERKRILEEFNDVFDKIPIKSVNKIPPQEKPNSDEFDFDFKPVKKKSPPTRKPNTNSFDF